MSKIVSKSGTWSIDVSSPSRADTPVLKIPNLTRGNLIRVTANFFASPDKGFYFDVKATNDDVVAMSPSGGLAQGSGGWQSCTRVAYFRVVKVSSPSGVEDADFEVLFSAGDLDGKGRLNNFLLEGTVVATTDGD
ncbi:hypothetical protein [Acanthopleuribacter pedis]|uniref:Uncharacterized protein n=1 Tax=Acanthopleuribacter pedis TaxID=442870 RepID=A0A8J7U8U7_9BACT|nr:hypothetical protein [Acanthopleuribacter pedis]MBO1322956.1 hypothetical protein [Acanthopleuribacter pedis]